jgi:hypothetical protein
MQSSKKKVIQQRTNNPVNECRNEWKTQFSKEVTKNIERNAHLPWP